MLAAQGVPHARCVILIEGCEESGSYDLPFGRDPVALDVLSVATLAEERRRAQLSGTVSNRTLFENAALLQLGTSDLSNILVERVP